MFKKACLQLLDARDLLSPTEAASLVAQMFGKCWPRSQLLKNHMF